MVKILNKIISLSDKYLLLPVTNFRTLEKEKPGSKMDLII